MKIVSTQEKLVDILNKLYLDGVTMYGVMYVDENNNLISSQLVQKTKIGEVYRYLKITKDYFKEIDYEGDHTPVKFDVEKLLKVIKTLSPKDTVELKMTKDEILLNTENLTYHAKPFTAEEDEVLRGLPFKMENDMPYLMKGTVPLINHITVSRVDFRNLPNYESILTNPVYIFELDKENNVFRVTIKEEKGLTESFVCRPKTHIHHIEDNVKLKFTQGIKELAKVFDYDINIRMKPNLPVWFYETSQYHFFGILLTPKVI